MTRSGRALLAGLLAGLGAAGGAAAQGFDPAKVERESAAVAARYPEPDVAYDTPAFVEGRLDLTRYDEMAAYLQALQRRAPHLEMRVVGRSQQGRDIPLLVLADPPASEPADLLRSGKPTLLLIGGQHGNEPAGGEAMLVMANRIALGDLRPLLARVNVLVMPRANPDGTEAFTRVTASGVDMNRDHLQLATGEARAVAAVVREYRPDVVVDAHETVAIGYWLAKFGGVLKDDALIQYATVANLPADLVEASETWFRRPMFDVLQAQNLSAAWYHTTAADQPDRRIAMGGTNPNVARNVLGLRNTITFLVETRGIGLGRAHLRRRVRTHEVLAAEVLAITAERGEAIMALTRRVEREVGAMACTGEVAVQSGPTREPRTVMFVDPETGRDKPVEVEWDSALAIKVQSARPRPCGYVLAASQERAARRLRALGVTVQAFTEPAEMEAERFRVTAREESAREDVRGTIGDAGGIVRVKVETERARLTVPAGAYWVTLAQPLAHLVVAALEPDTQESYVANKILSLEGEDALLRVTSPPIGARRVVDGQAP